ncbi:OmpA family protein [Hwangdonia lutea]|uniref:OmpA family protein n=1 Tax=Hwangdonia lutea TaxID=3075823 RepID=A0AA97EQU9_9FLAO|nr:OmpA family protein [Hwangdonia sp. SCSIO 19198]WOD44408.1 OmpA family protein [Hwangdonia sp. SCSIO 19198]
MTLSKNAIRIPMIGMMLLFFVSSAYAQTKQLKRPKSKVNISSVDNFVAQSFDLYDKVYKYDGYAAAGTPLDDDDIDVLEDALDDLSGLSDSAPDILGDIDGASVLKQAKATLQINKAKKALKYSIKTSKELLLGQRERDKKENDSDDDTSTSDEASNSSSESSNENDGSQEDNSNISDDLEIISKFDFVPGDKLLFFDDFSQDFMGDLPSKWNTNGSGAIVKLNKVEGNWFELKAGYRLYVIPDINELPQDYSIEFDLLTSGLTNQTSSGARLHIVLSDNNVFHHGKRHYAMASLPLGQYGAFNINAYNYFDGGSGMINSALTADIRDEVKNQPHIAISVTKKRYRLWVNEVKYIDIPRFIEKLDVLNYLKFHVYGLKDGEERVFIKNLKVAEGGVDLRRELLSKGKVSTNGILFDSGSAKIKPQSYGIIKQISQVLMQDESIKLNIIGHTDSDGSDEANLKLSKNRANAVKEALIKVYKISGNRLQTDGKGETQPVDDNSTAKGKAQNRRVEFVKI